MSTFLYFFPNASNVHSKQYDKLPKGLTTILDDASWSCVDATGPEGLNGCVIAIEPAPDTGGTQAKCGFFPDAQKWVAVKTGESTDYYIGFETDNPPTAADLRRDKLVNGSSVMLKGEEWIVPAVHAPTSTMPRTYKMTGDGVVAGFDPQYQNLMERSAKWYNAVFNNDAGDLKFTDEYQFSVDLLNVNYRLGLWEASSECLNLFTSKEVMEIIYAGLGLTEIVAEANASKKK